MLNTAVAHKTLRVRVKDKHAAKLSRMAASVNFVWNYINDLSQRSIRERGIFLSNYDLHKYTSGSGKLLGVHCHTIQRVCAEYVKCRKQSKKRRLAWRKTKGVRRSLGWLPIRTGDAQWKTGGIYYYGTIFHVWDSWGLEKYRFKTSSFSEDARGRWYFNGVIEYVPQHSEGTTSVGIDLGCKDAATFSDGTKISGHWYRTLQKKLAPAALPLMIEM